MIRKYFRFESFGIEKLTHKQSNKKQAQFQIPSFVLNHDSKERKKEGGREREKESIVDRMSIMFNRF